MSEIPPQFQSIFDRLENVQYRRGKNDYWICRCPNHDDSSPSLQIRFRNQRMLLKCFAGCSFSEIVRSLGAKESDLFEDDKRPTLDWKTVAVYKYCDSAGVERYQVVRQHAEYEGKRKKRIRQRHFDAFENQWVWNLDGVTPLPYRLPECLQKESQPIIVVEGEPCVDAVFKLGLLGTTNSGGAGKWTLEHHAKWFAGRRCAVIPDNDEPGFRHAIEICGSLLRVGADQIRLVNLPYAKPKDDIVDMIPLWGADARKILIDLIRRTPYYSRQTDKFEDGDGSPGNATGGGEDAATGGVRKASDSIAGRISEFAVI